MLKQYYIRTLKKELKPALGCTEPITVALATARASEKLNRNFTHIELILSGNIIKNGMGVGIPGTGMIGIDIAAVLGAFGGDSQRGLEVLENVPENILEKSKEFIKHGSIKIRLYEGDEKLYVKAIVKSNNHLSEVIIKDIHDNVVFERIDGEVIFDNRNVNGNNIESSSEEPEMSVEEIYEFSMTCPLDDLEFLLEGVDLNKALSDEGLKKNMGLKVGRTMYNNMEKGILGSDLKTYTTMRTASAVDARMDGSKLPAMSNSGSGDQGITVFMSIYSAWQKLELDQEKLLRSLALGNLIPIHIKRKLGRLSALCGGTVAGIGSSAAITYLLGGDLKAIEMAINNHIAGVSGLFCDGAKTSCALKVATSVDTAVNSSILAIENIGVRGFEGIIDDDVEKSISNMAKLGSESMIKTDKMILEIMMNKSCKNQ